MTGVAAHRTANVAGANPAVSVVYFKKKSGRLVELGHVVELHNENRIEYCLRKSSSEINESSRNNENALKVDQAYGFNK